VSGGHLSPGITITAALFKGFPPLKAVRYVVAQILGSFVACLVIYVQYHNQIKTASQALEAEGVLDRINFTPQGIAGSFALYAPAGSSLGYVFINEFVCVSASDIHQSHSSYLPLRQTFILSTVIWACVDPTNFYVPTSFISVVIALGYAMIIWGYAPAGIAANTARDVGGRMMAVTIWGTKAAGGAYAALAALTNIFATWVGLFVYEAFFADSSRGT
jgi:glycerol uptake facilitator-like aquaporin